MAYRILFLLIASMVSVSAIAQSTDAAAERARLANQRIQAEVERRQQEEQQRDDQPEAAAASVPADQTTSAPPSDTEPPADQVRASSIDPTSADDMSRMLEQLRSLGELKDAGYITEDEFARIKQRILDGTL